MVSVKLDRAHLRARMASGRERAGQALAEQILADCNQYSVPDDGEHTLKDSGRTEKIDGAWASTWNTVYAAYQYYGCWPDGSHVVQNYTPGYSQNPSILWCEAAKGRYGSDWEKVARMEYVKGADG